MTSHLAQPSFDLGIAEGPWESESPELWDGLVGAWLPSLGIQGGNAAQGTMALDLSGRGGTAYQIFGGGDSVSNKWVLDQSGHAMAFDGVDDYLVLPSGSNYAITNRFTITISVAISNATDNRYLYYLGNSSGGSQAAIVSGYVDGCLEFYANPYTGSDPRTGSQIAIPDGLMHTYTYAYDGVTWAGYRDGVQVFSVGRSFSLGGNADVHRVMSANSGGNVAGRLGAVLLHNRGLLAPQLSADPRAPWRRAERRRYRAGSTTPPTSTFKPFFIPRRHRWGLA